MTFTDEDLKRLKDRLLNDEGYIPPRLTFDACKALLSRLEAAEICCVRLDDCIRSYTGGWDSRGTKKDYEAWRKSKGE